MNGMSRKHKRRRPTTTKQPPVVEDASDRKVEGGWDEESRMHEAMNRGWEARGDDVDR